MIFTFCSCLLFIYLYLFQIQSRIDSFFPTFVFEGTSNQLRKNNRLKLALDLLKEKTRTAQENNDELILSEDDDSPLPKRSLANPKKRTKKTKLMNDVFEMVEKTKQRSNKKPNIVSPSLSDEESS